MRLALFSASRDQKAYFAKLAEKMPFSCKVHLSKKLYFPYLKSVDLEVKKSLQQQVEFLITRKKNTARGQRSSSFAWLLKRFTLNIKACWLLRNDLTWLHHEKAEYIGVWNGKKFRQAITVIAAQSLGKKIVYFERGPLPGYSMVDPKGVNYFSSNPRNKSFYQNYACHKRNFKTLPFKQSFKRVFIPFQVVEDSNIYLHSPWVHTMQDLFDLIEELSNKLPNWQFVFKEHPACHESYPDLHHRAEVSGGRLCFENDQSSQALIASCDLVITINSTVGVEALMAHKPLLVLGEALYAIEGIAYLVINKELLLQQFLKAISETVDYELLDKFICYLDSDYAVPEDAMNHPTELHWQAMSQKLKLILQGKADKALGLESIL